MQVCYYWCMDFDYIVADPTGNITVLVTSPYTAEERQEIIRKAFELEPDCEQVGFMMHVSDEVIRLEMMGYEFCGNATLSAAAWHAGRLGLPVGQESIRTVDSSGADGLLDVRVTRTGADSFRGTVSMPVPESGSFDGYPLISFEGISHMIVPSDAFTAEEAEKAVREYAHQLDVPALGLMLCNEYDDLVTDAPLYGKMTISPLVCVPESDTVVWEHGCATGSTAIGWYRWYQDPLCTTTELKQPGGIIRVDIDDGQPLLTGNVVFIPGK